VKNIFKEKELRFLIFLKIKKKKKENPSKSSKMKTFFFKGKIQNKDRT